MASIVDFMAMFSILIFAVVRKICQTQKLRNETNQKISLNKFKKVVAPKLCAQPKCMILSCVVIFFTFHKLKY